MSKQSFTDRKMYEIAKNLEASLFDQTRLAVNFVLNSNKGKQFRYTLNPPFVTDPWGDSDKPVSIHRVWSDHTGAHVEYYRVGGEKDFAPIERLSTDDIFKVLDSIFEKPTPMSAHGIWEDLQSDKKS